MPEQSQHPSSIQQLKARVQTIKVDASDALNAARHDYHEALRALRGLRSHSAVRAFVKSRFNGGVAGRSFKPGKQKPAKSAQAPNVTA